MENKINDESKEKSTLHTRTTGTWYLVLRIIPGVVLCVVLKKAQDSAPRAADAARYARAEKNATETYVKGAGKRGPRFFGANIELIIMPRGACAELIALRCAACLFMSRSERQYVCYLLGGHGDRERTIN